MIIPHFPVPNVGTGPKQSQSKPFLGANVDPKGRQLSGFGLGLPSWATSGPPTPVAGSPCLHGPEEDGGGKAVWGLF